MASKTSLPTEADVRALLANLSTPIVVPLAMDVQSEVDSAVDDWDRETNYRPFFQSIDTPVPLPFDPPGPNDKGISRGGSSRLRLHNGLIQLTGVSVGVNGPNGDLGTVLTLNQDYFLYPTQAAYNGEPWTDIDFSFPQRGLPQSIVVVGVWGYALNSIPTDAWTAIRDLAAARVLQDLLEGLRTGLVSIGDIDQHKAWSPELISNLGTSLSSRWNLTIFRYRLF